ncbi:hypothetical protein IV454_05905 [Massilia antarctica]|uniref:Uncharacterized protein n=1 Tax=Massilia antarctica TaxID=2765360 RepID=A0AA48WFI3_9BURK|nr:hypothetical protein [Massilia antarctica]QPI51081.1 hypothetical protein IV454_05905 [Massilia antarctica]
MFWKCIRWGGTLLVVLLVLAAALLAPHNDDAATPVQPVDTQPQPNKNFNF